MICDICGKQGARVRRTTRTFGSGRSAFLIEGVPLVRCPNCGESYFTADTLKEIERVLSAVPLAPLAIDRCISNANSRREKRRQLGADDERPQQGGGMAETPRDPGKVVEQFVDRVRAPVGERTLEVVPHELVGIELRRVRGEALHVQAGMAREERGDRRPAVD